MSRVAVATGGVFPWRSLVQGLFVRRWWLLLLCLGVGGAGAVSYVLSQKVFYQGEFSVVATPPVGDRPLGVNGETAAAMNTLESLRSPAILQALLSQLQTQNPRFTLNKLEPTATSGLQFTPDDQTPAIAITYRGPTAEEVQQVLDTLAPFYETYFAEIQRAQLQQQLQTIQTQGQEAEQQLQQAQEQRQSFQQQFNFLEPEILAQQVGQQVANLEAQFLATQLELNQAKATYPLLQQQIGLSPDQALAANYLSESPRYQGLLQELQGVEIKLAEESTRFLPADPTIQTLQEQQQNLLQLLAQEAQSVLGKPVNGENVGELVTLAAPSSVRSDLTTKYLETVNRVQVLQVQLQALQQAGASLKAQNQQLPAIARQYETLQTQVTLAQEKIDQLVAQRDRLEGQLQGPLSPWQVVEAPRLQPDPQGRPWFRALAWGVGAGFTVGLVGAAWGTFCDRRIYGLEDLSRVGNLPILATIPQDPQLQRHHLDPLQSYFLDGQRSPDEGGQFTLEAFRQLQSTLSLWSHHQGPTAIAITSPQPQEGKSTVAHYLALTAATMGKKVLLIDGDWRKPQLSQWYHFPGDQGLEEAIDRQALPQSHSLERLVNLDLLGPGQGGPGFIRQCSAEYFSPWLHRLKRDRPYDLILLDCPPLIFAEAKLLAPQMDGVILVNRLGESRSDRTLQAIQTLELLQAPLWGLVANGAQASRDRQAYVDYALSS